MTLVVGFLFMNTFRPIKSSKEDILDRYLNKKSGFDWEALWFASLVTAPTIILHELGHKIVALSFGFNSTFHAACSTTNIAAGSGFLDFYCLLTIMTVVLKVVGFGFLFFIPAFVQTIGAVTPMQSMLIALAGPFVNLILFVISWYVVKNYKKYKLSTNAMHFLTLTKNINIFLFVFNMLPIPGFDGFSIFYGLWQILFG
ncbi:MAG TPA: hypothetical protein V6C58_15525 [Allocoleopsis sp.]